MSERTPPGSSVEVAATEPSPGRAAELMAAETRTAVGGPARAAAVAGLPAKVGRYVVVGKLGEGGMGVVYEATDPELKRRVAVKVVRGRGASRAGQAALLREAQAMAQLSHPSVVPVFDVGTVDEAGGGGGVFIAMELVEGQTLRDWLKAARRPWKDVVKALVAAGRGLAAAHAAGIVHRDFKPANVLVGMDGRVRVTDFGLARVDDAVLGPEAAGEAGGVAGLTMRTAGVAGTPGYVAPEALDGVVDARGDQFAFCVSLYEALYGERPFASATGSGRSPLIELAEDVRRGAVKPAPRGSRVPGWLRTIVVRGLSPAPERRWPSLAAMLDEIERVPRRRRARLTVAATVGVVSAVVAGASIFGAEPTSSRLCTDAAGQLAGIWDREAGARLMRAFRAADPVAGEVQARSVQRLLDARATQWSSLHNASCRATHIERTRSVETLELRMQCLERRRLELAATVRVLVDAPTQDIVRAALNQVTRLVPLDGCIDDQQLATQSRLPEDPARRAVAVEIDRRIIDAWAEHERGDYLALVSPVAEIVRDARALGDPGIRGRALLLQAILHRSLAELEPAAARLREAAQDLARGGDSRAEATAWLWLADVLTRQKTPKQAFEVLAAAEAAVARAGDPLDLRADYLHRAGGLHYELDEFDKALQLAVEERELFEGGLTPPADRRYADALIFEAQIRYAMGKVDGVVELTERALELLRAIHGAEHPDVARASGLVGNYLRYLERFPEARARHEEALRIRAALFGADHPLMVDTENALALTLIEGGEAAAAVPHVERALEIARKHYPPQSRELAMALITYGRAMRYLARQDVSLRAYTEVIETQRQMSKPEPELIHALDARAVLHMLNQRNELALQDYLEELAVRDAMLGPEHPDALRGVIGVAQAMLRMERYADALPYLERGYRMVVELGERAPEPRTANRIRYSLGKALVELGRDRERGFALVDEARARFEELRAAQDLEVVDEWLAAKGRR